ncbi:lytic transglycosylase domain-containing protein [Variovorax atrisoli]|uniref:lytic transglycosylase domain-containing protein n=1 Tax=Variovorax atrisoli TaxID=3394203 RepID=UPI000F7E7786|nr:lytic transglycosylase domain-containing protein [Variovorax sp. 369]RTD94414.1 lytic transglycosylase domain-containing protein [Variovorax sp. 369]
MLSILFRSAPVLAALTLTSGAFAQTGGEALRDSTVTTSPDKAPPVPDFKDAESRLAYLRWLGEMSARIGSAVPDSQQRVELLQTVWYESKRAGLDSALVLGVIEVMSGYRRFAVTQNGALGLMAVNPSWAQTIGDGDVSKLFHQQSNLRFGCVVLRHYLDTSRGNLDAALRKYVANNLALADSNPRVGSTVNRIRDATARFAYAPSK